MKAEQLKKHLTEGGLEKYSALYRDIKAQTARFIAAIDTFTSLYGDDRDIAIFSVPGRSEIMGNHTDHNRGCVLAGAIDRDIIAVAAKRDDGVIRLKSEGYPEDEVKICETRDPAAFDNYTSRALVAGLVNGFEKKGYSVGGYDAYTTTEVLKGSGISSSAAFEVMIGNILNYLYNDGKVANEEIAKLSQYSENVYFGKPCGLMDQVACAVGGFVFIDFKDTANPVIEPIEFSLTERGYSLCIVNTGGNHADLNDDYASVPAEMKAVAAALGGEFLRGFDEKKIIAAMPALRETLGDRALLRAMHFVSENERVLKGKAALKDGDLDEFFKQVLASGTSSFKYLQNVYTTINVREQGLSLALCLAESFLADTKSAHRVHGGGFAGTVQVFLPTEKLAEFAEYMDSVFGKGASMPLSVRPLGACRLF